MKEKYWFEFILPAIFVLSVGILIGVIIKSIDYSDDIKQLEKEAVEAYNKGYLDGENYTLVDLMDVLIENAILKERLENQPSNQEYIEQIVDDFDLVIELQQYYYQEKITSHSFGDWLQINYPELYKRLESYF